MTNEVREQLIDGMAQQGVPIEQQERMTDPAELIRLQIEQAMRDNGGLEMPITAELGEGAQITLKVRLGIGDELYWEGVR